MGYERYPRDPGLDDYYNDQARMDDGRDYGSGRDHGYSGARQYQAAGEPGGSRERNRDYGYAEREQRGLNRGGRRYVRDAGFQGSYASGGHRFTDSGGRDYRPAELYRDQGRASDDHGRPQGYAYQDRDFFTRAGDEVRSWFGDDEAERRRELDARYDDRQGPAGRYSRDDDYHSWRRSQIDALDRDYDEYRSENRTKFENEFGSWRAERQAQRNSLAKVNEHMDVVGSDGAHIGTVDKVQGDRILLTKNDVDAGGHHHSIPSRWIQSVDDKVTIRKTAEDAKAHWRDEERGAFFGNDGDRRADKDDANGPHVLNRSFSGTY